MHLIDRAQIEIRKRQRSKMDPVKIRELRESILKTGLLHPIVVLRQGAVYTLAAGERRLTAIDEIQKSKSNFICDGQVVAPSFVPVTFLDIDHSLEGLMVAEFDENEYREPLPWQDRVQALAMLHEMRKSKDPTQTFIDTGKELVKKDSSVSNPKYAAKQVREAAVVAEHLEDPKVAGARNASEAFSIILKQEEEKARAALARRRIKNAASSAPDLRIIHGDMREVMRRRRD